MDFIGSAGCGSTNCFVHPLHAIVPVAAYTPYAAAPLNPSNPAATIAPALYTRPKTPAPEMLEAPVIPSTPRSVALSPRTPALGTRGLPATLEPAIPATPAESAEVLL